MAMQIGFVGLGTMGRHMAANLQKAGHALTVFDVRPELAERFTAKGARLAANPREAAASADIVFTSLPGPADVEAVALGRDGLIEGIKKGAAFFDLSTNSRSTICKISEAFAAKGAFVFDAPVSGGPSGAESGKLALWIGGDEAAFERFKPALDAIGDQVKYVGAVGQATVAKLVHNCVGYALSLALAEVFTMGMKAGVDPLTLFGAIRGGAAGRRRTFDGLVKQFLIGKYDPADFSLQLAHKDVSLAVGLGRELGVPMRICNLTLEELTEAMARGWQSRDARCFMEIQAERAGTDEKIDPKQLAAFLASDTSTVVVPKL